MIITEFYKSRKDGVNLFRTYSDIGAQIQKVGTDEIYDEAIDVENSGFEYVEINDTATEEDYQNALAELGVELNA